MSYFKTAPNSTKRKLLLLLIVSVAVLFSAEAMYRCFKYYEMVDVRENISASKYQYWVNDKRVIINDPAIGHRLAPNTDATLFHFAGPGQTLSKNSLHINNMGHVSRKDKAVQKDDLTYRIVVVGDSYTACLTNDFPWTDTLEDSLNSDAVFLGALSTSEASGKSFKKVEVFNLGQAGAGFPNFEMILNADVARLEPNLVILPFPGMDIVRDRVFLETVTLNEAGVEGIIFKRATKDFGACGSMIQGDSTIVDDPNRLKALNDWSTERNRQYINMELDRILFSTELLSYRDLLFALNMKFMKTKSRNYYSEATRVLHAFKNAHSNTLFIYVPIVGEVAAFNDPSYKQPYSLPEYHDIIKYVMVDGLRVENPITFLPKIKNLSVLGHLCKNDGHFTNTGARHFSYAVHQLIRTHVGLNAVVPPDEKEIDNGG